MEIKGRFVMHNKLLIYAIWFVFGLAIGFMMSEKQNEPINKLTSDFKELSKQNTLLNSKLGIYEQKYNTLYKTFVNRCGVSYVNID